FIVGLEEGILPHSRSLLSYEEMEEERRLMYVGLTRAKEKIYLLFTRQRTLFGSTQVNPPSRFLDDIPEELKMQSEKIKIENNSFSPNFKKSDSLQTKNYKLKTIELRDGDRVSHNEFGEGVVISVLDDIMVVAFKKVGIKRISTEYANLKKI
ncbi:MAG TPA: ATP-dependent DNA helicase PcrA, partial [Candidatus Moranbacteria bacterium]|nr:ATP-dependent DNA helicase PcrA [Candidatus Moranbacteria bacterium]